MDCLHKRNQLSQKLTDKSIQSQRLSENEDENNSDEKLGLLGICSAIRKRRQKCWKPAISCKVCRCRQKIAESDSSLHNPTQSFSPDTSVTNDANSHASGKSSQTAGQAGSKVGISIEEVVGLLWGLNNCETNTAKELSTAKK